MKISFTGLNERETFILLEQWLKIVKEGDFTANKKVEIENE